MKNRDSDSGQLFKYIMTHDVMAVRRLASVENCNTPDANGVTPLMHACIEKDLECVEILLNVGADPNKCESRGLSPLHFCAVGYFVEGARSLLQSGARVDSLDQHGNTPLARAVFESRGRGDMIRLLRQAGADPSHENHSGVSPRRLAETIANYKLSDILECPDS